MNTMTEIVRIEQIAANCDDENDAVAFQRPMTEAWNYYVGSNQFLTELRGLTRSYPFSGNVLDDAKVRLSPTCARVAGELEILTNKI